MLLPVLLILLRLLETCAPWRPMTQPAAPSFGGRDNRSFAFFGRRGAPAAVQAQCQSYGNRTEEIGLAGVEAVNSALELLGAAARQFRRMSQNLQSDWAADRSDGQCGPILQR